RHFGTDVETTDDGPDNVKALLLGGGNVTHHAGQSFIVEDGQDTDGSTTIKHGAGFGCVAHVGLNVPTAQGSQRFAAPLECDKTHFLVVDIGCASSQCRFHPILATH